MFNSNGFIGAMICSSVLCGSVSAATYYVSPLGDDANAGTSESHPFKMVQHAVDQMRAKDTLVVLDGVYTGTLKLKSGITLKAKNPRKAIFSGAEPLQGTFKKHKGAIYKIAISESPKQLFYKGQPMSWARWPNASWSENWVREKKWVTTAKGAGPGILRSESFDQLKDLDLAGGYCFLRYSKGNSCYSRLIESFDGTTLKWNDDDFYSVAFTGEDGRKGSPAAISKGKAKPNVRATFFLAGALDLVDSAGEWFAQDGFLYFYAPDGEAPKASDFLIKTGDYAFFEEQSISDLSIEGIDFFASSLKLANPANRSIVFRDSHFTYIGAEPLFIDSIRGKHVAKPVHVEGTQIGFDQCLFAGAQNTALQLDGSEVQVQNCVFAENNRHANFESRAVTLLPRGPFKMRRNTFFNNCSDAVLISANQDYEGTVNPEIAYNNICNAGLYNRDVSGVYMPNLSQHWTEFHHNWVHNVKGNGVRLDQAGEKLSVHHDVFWSSKRGLNIEGYGNFNVYNNTSVMNQESDAMTRNVVSKRKGTGDAYVSNDTTFPPITDWNVLNNLVEELVDRVGPSEEGPYGESKRAGKLNPERASVKKGNIPMTDRGAVQGNMTGFSDSLFTSAELGDLNLIPQSESVRGGASQTAKLAAEGVTALDSFRGAYDYGDKGWAVGSDWMPYGLSVPKTMAQAEAFAQAHKTVSMIPHVMVNGLPTGLLSENTYKAVEGEEPVLSKKKKRKKNK